MINGTYNYGSTPFEVIKKACNKQCPQGYSIVTHTQNEWDIIAGVVNQGIDSHLEAITERSKFNNGECLIHPDELHVFLRRLDETELEDACQLRVDILGTLGIEEI
jgi:predicted molibdopterin-dependent oxidoreductase YjgC